MDLTIKFPGASDATVDSTYLIERTLDNEVWSELVASQAATTPYVSPQSTLDSAVTYRATTITLVDATDFSSAGYGFIDHEALVSWTGKTDNDLTGVEWYSGAGVGAFLADSAFTEAHESYVDQDVTPTLGIALYRITHKQGTLSSPPTYLPFLLPPAPVSNKHCVVVVGLATDLGFEQREAQSITCELTTTDQIANSTGLHLGKGRASTRIQTTNAFGLAFFQCWKSSARITRGDSAAKGYTFYLPDSLTVTASTIPDVNWVLLEDIVDA